MREKLTSAPVWRPSAPGFTPQAIPGNRVDVCVIGAGIAGLSVAYRLSDAGYQVVVLDDGPVGGGQTGRTTAHLSCAIDDRLVEVERIRGTEIMRAAARSHAAAIDIIEETVWHESIDCDFERVPGYLFAAEAGHHELLEEEFEAAMRAGLDAQLVTDLKFPIGIYGPILRFNRQGQFHPLGYLGGLVNAIRKHRGAVVTDVHVDRVEDGAPAIVHLVDGRAIEADAIVVATNTPINDRLTIHTKQFPYTTYVVGFEATAETVPHALFWDTGDPYHYVRRVSGGGYRETVLVGGADHKTGQADDHAERFDQLEDWARRHFSGLGEITHRWSGQVLETLDGLAFIGRNPGNKNIYVATGDSGMGMTHGTIAGVLIADLIMNVDNTWEAIYDPSRKPLGALPRFTSENLNMAVQYGSWLTAGEVNSLADILPGSGAVIREGIKKIAVYRDNNGVLHARSAVCPHLAAIIRWNEAEKIWDCPAHGSRFDCLGGVIQGPANRDLEPVELPEFSEPVVIAPANIHLLGEGPA